MNTNTIELMDRGMRYLVEKLGAVDAEKFIATIIRERFDYTKWQACHFANEDIGNFNNAAMAWARKHEAE